MSQVEQLADTVRGLREDGRKRAKLGPWKVRISANHATFEHEDAAPFVEPPARRSKRSR